MSINDWGSNIPVEIAKGGTNATSMATTNGTNIFDGTRIVTTATGVAGQVLTSNGAAAPTYQAIGGGAPSGNFVLIQTLTAANSATLAFTAGFAAFRNLLFVLDNILPASNNVSFFMDLSFNNGATWQAAAGFSVYFASGVWTETPNGSPGFLTPATLANTGAGLTGTYWLYNNNVDFPMDLRGDSQMTDSSSVRNTILSNLQVNLTTNHFSNAYRFKMSAGNITSGSISLYGLST